MSRVTRIRRNMSISHAEFLRSLAPLGKHYPYEIDPSRQCIRVTGKAGLIQILLGEERRKHLGSLELPETTVEFRFPALNKQEIELFLSRFDLCFQRGGG